MRALRHDVAGYKRFMGKRGIEADPGRALCEAAISLDFIQEDLGVIPQRQTPFYHLYKMAMCEIHLLTLF